MRIVDECDLVIREGVGVMCTRADHQPVERTANPGEPLPPIPPCWSPSDAEELPVAPDDRP